MPELKMIPLNQIKCEDRLRKDVGDVTSLVESIRKRGIIQPIAVELRDKYFYIIGGGRRYTALTKIDEYVSGTTLVSCNVFTNLSQPERRVLELEENLHRKDFAWHEEIEGQLQYHEAAMALHGEKDITGSGWDDSETAKQLGISKSSFSKNMKLAINCRSLPTLRKCKTKQQAEITLQKIERELVRSKVVSKIKGGTDKPKAKSDAKISKDLNLGTAAKKMDREEVKQLIENYHTGDIRELLPTISDGWAHFAEIDPPYAIDIQDSKKSKVEKGSYLDKGKDYNEINQDEYFELMKTVANETYRILADKSWFICWLPFQLEHLTRQIFQAVGFEIKPLPCAWIKGSGQSQAPMSNLASAYEIFIYGRKGTAQLEKARLNTFQYNPVPADNKIHITERPTDMMEDIIATFALPGARILCPFMGSGNTALAGANYGDCVTIGADLTPRLKKDFTNRVLIQPYGEYNNRIKLEDIK